MSSDFCLFIGFIYNGKHYGCKQFCDDLLMPHEKLHQVIEQFVQTTSVEDIMHLFHSIKWVPFNPQIHAPSGSLLINLLKFSNIDLYEQKVKETVNSLKQGRESLGFTKEELPDSLYKQEFDKYITIENGIKKAVITNDVEESSPVTKKYLFDLDQKLLIIEDEHSSRTIELKQSTTLV